MNDMRNRGKGRRRVFFTLAIVWLPITGILTPVLGLFGYFSDEEVLTFFFSGVALFVVLGLLAPWVARGFTAEKKPPQ